MKNYHIKPRLCCPYCSDEFADKNILKHHLQYEHASSENLAIAATNHMEEMVNGSKTGLDNSEEHEKENETMEALGIAATNHMEEMENGRKTGLDNSEEYEKENETMEALGIAQMEYITKKMSVI